MNVEESGGTYGLEVVVVSPSLVNGDAQISGNNMGR
jgi:hypothetical protein